MDHQTISGVLNGVITAVLLLLYIGIFVWAWSRNRKPDFERASRLPFLDDPVAGHGNDLGGPVT